MGELGSGVINLKRKGLPCRKNCGFVAYAATDHIREHLLLAIAERDDHEKFAHDYIHVPVPTTAWTPFQKPGPGFKPARKLRGGAK